VDIGRFERGYTLLLHDGTRGKVLSPSEDGRQIRVRYVESPNDPALVGTEGLVAGREVSAFIPAPPGADWGMRLTVAIHYVPESEDSEAYYEAVTMGGTPYGVSVVAEDSDAAQAALDRLFGSLAAFGYAGTVAVEDMTGPGAPRRFEADVEG
jgi:hypothetical protein